MIADRRKALNEADFIISQVRVGGSQVRIKDERISLELNIVGQKKQPVQVDL